MKPAIAVLVVCSVLFLGYAILSREDVPADSLESPREWNPSRFRGGLANDRETTVDSRNVREVVSGNPIVDEFSSWFASQSEALRRFLGVLPAEQKEWIRGMSRGDHETTVDRLMRASGANGIRNDATSDAFVGSLT